MTDDFLKAAEVGFGELARVFRRDCVTAHQAHAIVQHRIDKRLEEIARSISMQNKMQRSRKFTWLGVASVPVAIVATYLGLDPGISTYDVLGVASIGMSAASGAGAVATHRHDTDQQREDLETARQDILQLETILIRIETYIQVRCRDGSH